MLHKNITYSEDFSAQGSCSPRGNKQFSNLVLGLLNVRILELFFQRWKADWTLPDFPNCAVKHRLFCKGYTDSSSNLLSKLTAYLGSLMWCDIVLVIKQKKWVQVHQLSSQILLLSRLQVLEQDFTTQRCVCSCLYSKYFNWYCLILVSLALGILF